jgi:hypothetical protein
VPDRVAGTPHNAGGPAGCRGPGQQGCLP